MQIDNENSKQNDVLTDKVKKNLVEVYEVMGHVKGDEGDARTRSSTDQ